MEQAIPSLMAVSDNAVGRSGSGYTDTEVHMAKPLITESVTQRTLEALNPNKGAGPSGLFPIVLKTLSPYIAPTLSRIFHVSLQTSQIPDDGRHAIVTPVPKAHRTVDPNLFRPSV